MFHVKHSCCRLRLWQNLLFAHFLLWLFFFFWCVLHILISRTSRLDVLFGGRFIYDAWCISRMFRKTGIFCSYSLTCSRVDDWYNQSGRSETPAMKKIIWKCSSKCYTSLFSIYLFVWHSCRQVLDTWASNSRTYNKYMSPGECVLAVCVGLLSISVCWGPLNGITTTTTKSYEWVHNRGSLSITHTHTHTSHALLTMTRQAIRPRFDHTEPLCQLLSNPSSISIRLADKWRLKNRTYSMRIYRIEMESITHLLVRTTFQRTPFSFKQQKIREYISLSCISSYSTGPGSVGWLLALVEASDGWLTFAPIIKMSKTETNTTHKQKHMVHVNPVSTFCFLSVFLFSFYI